MDHLSADHFLSLPRPDITSSLPAGVVDTTTLAAHDFDVDTRTGFMPPQAPLERLPSEWDLWELALDEAIDRKLQLGDKPDLTEEDKIRSETWRAQVRKVSRVAMLVRITSVHQNFLSCLSYPLRISKPPKSCSDEPTKSSLG